MSVSNYAIQTAYARFEDYKLRYPNAVIGSIREDAIEVIDGNITIWLCIDPDCNCDGLWYS